MSNLVETPVFGLLLTFGVWIFAAALRGRVRSNLANPVAVSVALIILILSVSRVSYDQYNVGGSYLSFLLGPSVVAMAVPLYRRREDVRRHWRPLLGGVAAGSLTGILTAALIAKLLGAAEATVLSLAPKSVTTPIAIGIVEQNGGIPSLTAAICIITGMLGAMVGPEFLRGIGVRSPMTTGLALGAAAHGIGTARAFEEDDLTGVASSIGMLLNGLVTAIILPYVVPYCL